MDSPLRSARLKRELTLPQVGMLVGIDMGQLSRIERNGKTSRETAARLAKFFAITEEQVLYPERFMGKRRRKAA